MQFSIKRRVGSSNVTVNNIVMFKRDLESRENQYNDIDAELMTFNYYFANY